MAMVNMQQSVEEAQEELGTSDAPKYPYGLELRLDEEALAKLGMSAPPAVGTVMTISAKVIVTSASQYQTLEGEPEASSCWQITDMEASTGTATADPATALYGGK